MGYPPATALTTFFAIHKMTRTQTHKSHHYDRKAAEAQEMEDEEEEDMEEILTAEAKYEMEQIGEQDGQETGEVPVVGKRHRSVEREEEANSWYPWSKG